MQLSQRRMLMKAQLPVWRSLYKDKKAIAAFEKAQRALFASLDDSAGGAGGVQAGDASEGSARGGMQTVETRVADLSTTAVPARVTLTEKLLIRASATVLEGRLACAQVAGSVQLFCRYYDYAKRPIAIDFTALADGAFFTPVPTDAHYVAFGCWLGEESDVSFEGLLVAGIMLDETPVDPDNLTPYQNEIAASFSKDLESMIACIPDSNGSGYYRNARRPHVGIITDDFMYNYYADALDLEYLTPEGYGEQLASGPFDFVLYVTCWLGMRPADEKGLFDYRSSEAPRIVPTIFERAREFGIPTIFQSIEDPTCYKLFLPIAKAADVVFTTAVEVIPDYVRDTKNPLVFHLPYGINPSLHNPVGCMKKYALEQQYYKDSVFFAGSWYGLFEERCHDTAMIFDSIVRDAGKNIILADRTLHAAPEHHRPFPAEYNEFIVEPMEYRTLQKAHKLFDISVNLNTVKDSQTMGAMRVYEVQALGGLLVSNASKSLANFFPDIFAISEDSDVKAYFDGLTRDEIVRTMVKGIRRVFSEATVYDRLNSIFLKVGLPLHFDDAVVHVFADVEDGLLVDSFGRQTYAHKVLHPTSELDAFPAGKGFYAVMDAPYESDHFLEDAMNAFKYVDASFVQVLPFDRYIDSFDYMRGRPEIGSSVFAGKEALIGCMGADNAESLDGFAIISI